MKVVEFNRINGIYKFELDDIHSDYHSHPALEMLYSISSDIEIEIREKKYSNISLAIIGANVIHKVTCLRGTLNLSMFEGGPNRISDVLEKFNIELSSGLYIRTFESSTDELVNALTREFTVDQSRTVSDDRVRLCVEYLNDVYCEYNTMICELKVKTKLSESRLSHLFKKEMGISMKKYLVWSRLKKAFELVLEHDLSMYDAAFTSGFYDQAHLSKAFKQMLGIKPSGAYNSRTIQV